MIVDAGGGTVDISTYSSIQSPNVDSHAFEEIAAPACSFPRISLRLYILICLPRQFHRFHLCDCSC